MTRQDRPGLDHGVTFEAGTSNVELLAGMAFLLRKCFEKLGRSGIALFGGGLARRSEPLAPCGRLRGVACVIAHDAAPDAKDERSGAARVMITTRPPARLTNAAGRLCRSRHGRRRGGVLRHRSRRGPPHA